MGTHFGNYNPSSYGWEQGNIVPFVYGGVSFPGGVHPLAAPIFRAFLDRLMPLMPRGLVAGWCWGYSGSSVTTGGTASHHTYGLALDLNAPINPFLPGGGSAAHDIPDAAGPIARDLGMEWGGDWTQPVDYMHVEIHLDPDGAAELGAQLASGGGAKPAAPTPRSPEEDAMYILNEKIKGNPNSVRVAILSGPMFVGIGGEEVRHANTMMSSGRALFQWVESQTWDDLDRRSRYVCGIGR